MRIVLLTQWYPPEPAQLISGLAEGLHKKGHEITVLTGFPNYPSGRLYPGYRLKLWQRELVNGVNVVRVPLFPSHDTSPIKRTFNYVSFGLSASLCGLVLVKKPDVIHVYHPPLTTLAAGWFLSRLRRIPLTVEIQDMWPETLSATGMVRSQMILRTVGWVARWLYKRAAAIRVISKGFSDNLKQKQVLPNKIHVIPNWTELPSDPLLVQSETKASLEESCFNILFAGNIGLAQGLGNVLEAARLLIHDAPRVKFVFVGDGIDLQRLQETATDNRLENVVFLGRCPPNEMPQLFAQADVLLVHLSDAPLFRITIPHKVYSYMASGKPILAVATGDCADAVVSAGAGVACPPGKPAALAKAVNQLSKMPLEQRERMGDNGKRAVHEKYSREKISEQLEAMIISVVRE